MNTMILFTLTLMLSVSSLAATDLSKLAKDNGLHSACLEVTPGFYPRGSFILNGGLDLTDINHFQKAPLGNNGCAAGQIQVLSVEQIQPAAPPVK